MDETKSKECSPLYDTALLIQCERHYTARSLSEAGAIFQLDNATIQFRDWMKTKCKHRETWYNACISTLKL